MKKISWVSLGFIVCIHGICLGFEAKSDIPLIAAYACQTNGVAQSCPPEHPIYGGGMLSNFQHSWIQVINKSNDYVITTANGDEIKLFLITQMVFEMKLTNTMNISVPLLLFSQKYFLVINTYNLFLYIYVLHLK